MVVWERSFLDGPVANVIAEPHLGKKSSFVNYLNVPKV